MSQLDFDAIVPQTVMRAERMRRIFLQVLEGMLQAAFLSIPNHPKKATKHHEGPPTNNQQTIGLLITELTCTSAWRVEAPLTCFGESFLHFIFASTFSKEIWCPAFFSKSVTCSTSSFGPGMLASFRSSIVSSLSSLAATFFSTTEKVSRNGRKPFDTFLSGFRGGLTCVRGSEGCFFSSCWHATANWGVSDGLFIASASSCGYTSTWILLMVATDVMLLLRTSGEDCLGGAVVWTGLQSVGPLWFWGSCDFSFCWINKRK